MADKTTDKNKIDIQNRQNAIDAEIVDTYLIKNPNSKKKNQIVIIQWQSISKMGDTFA